MLKSSGIENFTLSELLKDIKIYPQLLVNVKVNDKKAAREDEVVKAAAAKVEQELGDEGRLLLRESGTEPLIRVMVEAKSDELCAKYAKVVTDALKKQGQERA